MSNGYRSLGIPALAAALFIAFGLGAYWTGLPYPQERYQPYQSSDKVEERAAATVSNVAARVVERTPCNNPQSEGESDLCAQWRAAKAAEKSANWTVYGFWATLAGMALLTWQIILTREAVKDTGDATVAMQKSNDIAIAAHRPWIAIALYVERAVVIDGRLQIAYRIDYKNIGQTVAQFFVPKHTVEITGGAFTKVVTEIQSAAREKDVNNSRVLMPNEIYNHTGKKSYDLGKMVWAGRRKRRFLAVSASAFYNLPGDKWGDHRRHTERTFLIVTEDTSGRPEGALFRSRLPEEGHVRLQIRDAAPRSAS